MAELELNDFAEELVRLLGKQFRQINDRLDVLSFRISELENRRQTKVTLDRNLLRDLE